MDVAIQTKVFEEATSLVISDVRMSSENLERRLIDGDFVQSGITGNKEPLLQIGRKDIDFKQLLGGIETT